MTDQVSADVPTRRTRRQLLAGGTGALAAVLTAEALARPAPAQAADGNPVILGQGNAETTATVIRNNTAGADVLDLEATGNGSGLAASTDSGDGVVGASNSGNGVFGTCTTGVGVVGVTFSASASGVQGQNLGGGAGVIAMTNSGAGVAAVHGQNTGNGTGVFGECAAGTGVSGNTDGGLGVSGFASSGTAVFGSSSSGNGVSGTTGSTTANGVLGTNTGAGSGVLGQSKVGAGVVGTTDNALSSGVVGQNAGGGEGVFGTTSGAAAAVHGSNTGSGVGVRGECAAGTGVLAIGATALSVQGRAAFSRSGVLTIAAGKSSATQTGVALTSASLVLATLQQDRAGVWVRSAVLNVTGSSFTVHLSKAVAASTTVAWFVVN